MLFLTPSFAFIRKDDRRPRERSMMIPLREKYSCTKVELPWMASVINLPSERQRKNFHYVEGEAFFLRGAWRKEAD